MLNSTELEISTAHKMENAEKLKDFSDSKIIAFIMLRNVKMPMTFGILTFMSMINFMLSWVDHEKFYNLEAW